MSDDHAARVREELRTRCVHLCTKAAFFPLPQQGDATNPSPTAIWWCARTLRALGPDGTAAHPSLCDAPGRRCYEPPVRP